jgi:amino acid transporter
MSCDEGSGLQGAVRHSRVLRLSWIVALGASVSAGLGVYTLLGHYVRLAGGYSTAVSYLGLMAIALPMILTYAERAGVIPGGGGAYSLSRAGGRLGVTYATGWMLIAGYASLAALLGWGMALHLDLLLERFFDLSIPLPWLAAALIGLVALNRTSATTRTWRPRVTFVYLTVLALLLRAIGDVVLVQPGGQQSIVMGSPMGVMGMTALMVCGLWGFEFVLTVRDEIRRPTRTILPALALIVIVGGGLGALAALTVARHPGATAGSLTPLLNVGSGLGWLPEGLVAVVYAIFGLGLNLLALGHHRQSAPGRRRGTGWLCARTAQKRIRPAESAHPLSGRCCCAKHRAGAPGTCVDAGWPGRHNLPLDGSASTPS